MSCVLKANELTKIYDSDPTVAAVDHISFELAQGEILGFLGPNGSGKTTTIQMLLGTLSCTSGTIEYFGMNLQAHRSEVLQKVSFASTYTNMPWILTLEENLKVHGALYGLSAKESEKRFDPLLERFGILDKKRSRTGALSAGQITRLMLVKAFFIEPAIALLDEPTASLDPEISNDICTFLLEQRNKHGVSILFTSHKMEEVMEICDRTIFLKKGKIIADDIPENLAKSVGQFTVKLILTEGIEKALSLAEKAQKTCKVEGKILEAAMSEEEIPHFLSTLHQEGISYASIRIAEPSLEDYFLQIAKRGP